MTEHKGVTDEIVKAVCDAAWRSFWTREVEGWQRVRTALEFVWPERLLTEDEQEAVRQFVSYEKQMNHDDPERYWALIESARQKLKGA